MTSCLPSADTLTKISKSWELLTTTFGDIAHSSEKENIFQNSNILSSLQNLYHFDLHRSFIDWYYNEVRQYLKEEIVEPFRNKSKSILSVHYQKLRLFRNKRHSISSLLSNESNSNQPMHSQSNTMNFETFDTKIWGSLLQEISALIGEVYSEIFKIHNNVWKISTLLNALHSSKNKRNHNTLHTLRLRLNTLIDTIFLMDGSDEFESIFRVMFEYSFIYFSQTTDENDSLMLQFKNICNKLYKLRWLNILESVFINVGYEHIEYELFRNYKARKAKNIIDYSLFEHPLLHKFETWVNQILIKWLHIITNSHELNECKNNTDSVDIEMKNNNTNPQSDRDALVTFLTPSKSKRANKRRISIETVLEQKQSTKAEINNISNGNNKLCLLDLKEKISYFLFEKFGEMRTMEMFDIILTYPQSVSALNDLKLCLNITEEWRPLQISMLQSYKKRLLHHGACSKDIITQYIATIQALKYLDPTGLTLEIVGEPIRIYLRGREDAIRCVVSHLMENDTSLLREFQQKIIKKTHSHVSQEWEEKNESKFDGNGNESSDESVSSELENDCKQWKPLPLDSMFAKNSSIFKRNTDTIGLLVKIFGSREIFVEEYRKLLGDRLLQRQSKFFSVDKETEYLELMKLRFGSEYMQDCTVMVRDISNAERDTNNIQTVIGSDMLSATIISNQYWPQSIDIEEIKKGKKVKLPRSIEKLFECFEETYAQIKKPREIYWVSDYGCVELEIELNQQLCIVKCKPLHASVLMIVNEYFEESKESEFIALSDLSKAMEMKEESESESEEMESVIQYWLKRGIIKKVFCDQKNKNMNQLIGYRLCNGKNEELYALNCLKNLKKKSSQNGIDGSVFNENDINKANIMNNMERETISAEFERTVLGVLTVFQGSPIERIITLLKQMKLHPLYAKITIHQLQNVLDKLTNEKRVLCEDGMYKRSK